MSNSQGQRQVLKIPPQLYSKLAELRYTPQISAEDVAAQEWKELVSTQKFTDVVFEDTPNNLTGLFRAFKTFPYDENVKAAKEAIKSVSIVVKTSSQPHDSQTSTNDSSSPQRHIFGYMEELLIDVIFQMTGLQTISLDLGHFTEEEARRFYNAMNRQPGLIWREMHSIRVRGHRVLADSIMCSCDPAKLKALDLDRFIWSRGYNKAMAIDCLERLHLFYNKDHLTYPAPVGLEFPSCDKRTWSDLRMLCSLSGGRLDWVILREADCDRKNEFRSMEHLRKLREAFNEVREASKAIKVTRLAFTFDYRRFSSKIIRADLSVGNTNSNRLKRWEVKKWHEQRIRFLMENQKLKEVWIFIHSSLVYAGTRNSDEAVTVQGYKLNAEVCERSFPWGLLDK